jgi:hypothetical protein
MQIFRLADPLKRRDFIALVHGGEAETGIHPPPIDVHRACTALAVIASLFRSGQMQVLSQAIQERGAGIYPQVVLLAVDTKCDRDGILRFC